MNKSQTQSFDRIKQFVEYFVYDFDGALGQAIVKLKRFFEVASRSK